MSAYKVVWDRERECWSVYRTGPFARYVASFKTLLEAEDYATGRECPDEVEA